jgi:hypothetical protein
MPPKPEARGGAKNPFTGRSPEDELPPKPVNDWTRSGPVGPSKPKDKPDNENPDPSRNLPDKGTKGSGKPAPKRKASGEPKHRGDNEASEESGVEAPKPAPKRIKLILKKSTNNTGEGDKPVQTPSAGPSTPTSAKKQARAPLPVTPKKQGGPATDSPGSAPPTGLSAREKALDPRFFHPSLDNFHVVPRQHIINFPPAAKEPDQKGVQYHGLKQPIHFSFRSPLSFDKFKPLKWYRDT